MAIFKIIKASHCKYWHQTIN